MWKMLENQLFFREDIAGLWKYHMGRNGWIGVYRVNDRTMKLTLKKSKSTVFSSFSNFTFVYITLTFNKLILNSTALSP